MDSSFLTALHVGLGLFALIQFLKTIVQFGLPNHPGKFVCYVVGLCAATYFLGLAATDLYLISPWAWMRWRTIPLIAGSLCVLLQTIMLTGSLSLIQQKVIARLPFMGAIISFVFFPGWADRAALVFLFLGGLFLIISVRKARYQKRLFYKMLLMLTLASGTAIFGNYWFYVVSQMILFLVLFYLFLFEQTFGLSSLIDDFKSSVEGDLR